MPKLLSLDHVGLTAADLEASVRFYQALGMELLRTGGPNAEGVRSAVLRAGGQELNIFSRPGLIADERDDLAGMHHYCLRVEAASIDALIEDLRQAGLEIYRGPIERRDGTSVFLHDPDRVRVELFIPGPPASSGT